MRRQVAVAIAATAAAVGLAGCGDSESVQQTDVAESASLTDSPVIASWTTVGGIEVPIGESDGPGTGVWEPFTGFSHTPKGAALAAITQSVQLSTAPDNSWATTLAVVAASGEGRDAYAANRALISVTGLVDPAVAPTIVGYVIADYDDTAAAVDVVQRFPDDSVASTRSNVVWVDGDWKLDLAAGKSRPARSLTVLPNPMVKLEGTGK